MSFSISKIPNTYLGKLMLIRQSLLESEESFDDEHPTFAYQLTEKEQKMFEIVQCLGLDFIDEITELINLAHPSIGLARNIEEAERMLEHDREV